jgi:hypothetical protein
MAEQQGPRTALRQNRSDLDETPIKDLLEVLVRIHLVHATRRLHEVKDAEGLLTDASRYFRSSD